MRKALSSLPKELDGTYDQTMARIRSQSPQLVLLAERVLGWISNARRPLSVEELQHALAVHPEDVCAYRVLPGRFHTHSHFAQKNFDEDSVCTEEDLVSACAGLVTVDRESRVIRLVHYTTQAYFERVRSELFPNIQVGIVEACITYLEFEDLESFTRREECIEVSKRLHSRYIFLNYAGTFWGHHARGNTECSVGSRIVRLLCNELRLTLACDLIDHDGMRSFGPAPALTVLIHFGLERMMGSLNLSDASNMTVAIRYRHDIPVFLLVEPDADWYDNGKYVNISSSYFTLEGNETMVRSLNEKGVNIDLGFDNGEFVFMWSLLKFSDAERGEPMSTLFELGAKFDPENIPYYTPLMYAVIVGDNVEILRLSRNGIDVNEKNERGRDALIYAALARYEVAVRALLKAGADVHSRDEDGMTPLIAACTRGHVKIAKLLIDNGADISACDIFGRTPISIASEASHTPLLRLLRGDGTEECSKSELVKRVESTFERFEIEIDWDFGRPPRGPNRDVTWSRSQILEAVRRAASRLGYDKKFPAPIDISCKEEANETMSDSDEEQRVEQTHSDDSASRLCFASK